VTAPVDRPDDRAPAYGPPAGPLQIHHLDAHLVAIDKPSGLLSVPGRGPDKADCAEARLAAQLGWVRAVHRLDMDTSGLLLLARTPAAHRTLSAAFAARSVEKTYIALVHGRPGRRHGRIEAPLRTDWPNRPRQLIDPDQGKPAITEWHCVLPGGGHGAPGEWGATDGSGDCTRLVLHPLTGRSHQLRVHLASIGHPILGDPFYAPYAISASAPRLMLHASALSFAHPVSGAPVQLRSPPGF